MKHIVKKSGNFQIWEYEILDSTNEEAKRIILKDKIDNLVLVAKSQSKGKGRGNNYWVSEEGNLFFSIIINSTKIKNPELLSFITAISVFDIIKLKQNNLAIKWPNDLLIDEKKFCGILLEKFANSVIIGVGVNINSCPQYLDNKRKACFLEEYMGKINIAEFLEKILVNFSQNLLRFRNDGFENFRNKIVLNLYNLNKIVTLDYLGNKIKGEITGISTTGNLELETAEGLKQYSAGEIFV